MKDSLQPSRRWRALSVVASGLWWTLVVFWLLLALAWGALHGWIVPRVDEWRPVVERQASQVLGIPVRIAALSAHSDSLMPSIELRDVVLHDAQGREALRLSRVVVALSPRSLWNLGFEQLYIEGPQLDVRRSADGRLWVAGLDVSRGGGDERAANWFFRQREVVVLGGTLRWTDEQRSAPPLVLSDLQFVVRNGPLRHALRLDATPPAIWGERFSLRGIFRQPLLSRHPGRWQDWKGQLYADFAGVDLPQLRQYAPLGVEVRSGRGALQAWADVADGQITGGAAQVALTKVDALLAPGRTPLLLNSVSGRLSGKRLPRGFEFETRELQFQTADGRRWPGGNVALTWQGPEGQHSAEGKLKADRLDLDALRRLAGHLPLDAASRALLEAHAPKGLVDHLQASWEGPAEAPAKFQARGRLAGLELPVHAASGRPGLRGVTLDFDVTQAGGKGRLVVDRGQLEMPGLFEEPRVPIDQLSADLQWQQVDGRATLNVTGLKLRNADLQLEGQVRWKSGDAARGRWPGELDLQLNVPRAEAARVWRYLPQSIPKATRDYVRDAVTAGKATDGQIRVRGDLHDFPFTQPGTGEFRISTRVSDVAYAYVPRSTSRWPGAWRGLTGLSGELVFDRNSLQVNGAKGSFAGAPGLQVQADAAIADLAASVVVVTGQVRGPLAESLAVFNATPVASSIGQPFAGATASGTAELRLRLGVPLAAAERTTVQGSVAFANNDLQLMPDVPQLSRLRGTVSFTEGGFTLSGVQGRALGGDVRLDGGTRALPPNSTEPASVVRIQGTATAEGLRQARELGTVARLARQATGTTAYAATVGVRPGGVDVVVTSSLQGMALPLPAPFAKTADTALPLRFEIQRQPGATRLQDRLSLELGRLASAVYVRDLSGPEPRVLRGAIGVGLGPGESAPMPDQGVYANISFAQFNVDAWDALLSATGVAAAATPGASGPSRPGGIAPAVQGYLPTTAVLRAREFTFAGRTFQNVLVGGSREGLLWRANVDASQLNGYLEYRQPSGSGTGRLLARLARLSIAASAATDVEALLDEQPASIPALDIVVEDFELRGKKLGRLEIDAVNRQAGSEWRLNKLALTTPEASFNATGNWVAVNAQLPASRSLRAAERRRTVMNFRLDVADAGQLLTRIGMKDVVRRGRGKLEGQVAWLGSPLALDYPSLGGAFSVNVESGQFLKADPGLAKLLGVLSLQSLPRRLALDFRDVFSEGFPFDFVRGDVTIAQGIASTNNLQMKGVNAAVLMEGRADVARETQDLKVVVVPEINAGTASLVASVINPAVGLGSFLAQLFLREPLSRATTQEFHIDGTWTEPRVTRVARPAPAPAPSGGVN
ncbi:MAG: hypothetical protein RL522_511 [Pseudomonadota bacterium]|jgi:uncharacterized protein (TIGR02099 family)